MSFSPRCLVVSCMCFHLPRNSLPTSSFVALTSVANTLALFVSAHGGHFLQAFFKIVRNFFVLRRGCSQKLQWKNSQRMWFHWPKHAFSTSPNVPWLHCANGAEPHLKNLCDRHRRVATAGQAFDLRRSVAFLVVKCWLKAAFALWEIRKPQRLSSFDFVRFGLGLVWLGFGSCCCLSWHTRIGRGILGTSNIRNRLSITAVKFHHDAADFEAKKIAKAMQVFFLAANFCFF